MKEEQQLKEIDIPSDEIEQGVEKGLFPSSSAKQEIKEIIQAIRSNNDTSHEFLLRVVQPDGRLGLNTCTHLCHRFCHPQAIYRFSSRYGLSDWCRH